MPLSHSELPTLKPAARPNKHAGPRGWALALFAVAMAGVIWGELSPAAPSLSVSNIDKLQHFGAYALLAALAFLGCRTRSWRVALALVGLGVALEFAQGALDQGRDASLLDALANTAGVVLVTLGWRRR